MSKIILFGNQKGGVGKSTLTAMAAAALSSEPFSRAVYVADVDPQQSLIRRRLADLRAIDLIPSFKIEFKTLSQLLAEIDQLDQVNDFIFVDAPGKLDNNLPADQQEITKILLLADFLFIPIVPGNFSLDATLDYLKIALKAKARRQERPLEIVALVNMAEPRTLDDRFLIEELEELKAVVNIKFMATRLNRYALFRAADTLGSIYEAGSADKAKANFSEWIEEFIEITQN